MIVQGTSLEQTILLDEKKSALTLPMHVESLKSIDDMVMLRILNNASILHNLKLRFRLDEIYTAVGTSG